MKLEKILVNLNSFEKNSFLKIIDGILANEPKNIKEIEKILSDSSKDLKNMDNINVAKVFNLVQDEFRQCIKEEFVSTTSQLDILSDIVSKDGNSIMKQDWFARLYEKELAKMDKKLKEFKKVLESEKGEVSQQRLRDYKIYHACLYTAYNNDKDNNQERKVTTDEQSIIMTLSQQLELSLEEIKLINHLIIPVQKQDIDTVINYLKNIGVIFYSKKTSTIYVADEVTRILRKIRGKEIADKFFRRVLRLFREPQINVICRKHQIDWRLPLEEKIKAIISAGISFSQMLMEDMHKEGTNVTDKKKFINELCDNDLKISPPLKGVLIDEKVNNLIQYFEDIERDEKVGISIDGYEKLLIELGGVLTSLNELLRTEFELQEEKVLRSNFLLDFNIKPRDVLEIVSQKELEEFCKTIGIKTRGDIIQNILENYKDAENLYLENYENIGFRNFNLLKENGISIKEANLGIKFEDLTKTIFEQLGFNVDEPLRKKLNTAKDKADILLNIGNNELILVECKTIKESGYNKFSSVSRQLKSYQNLALKNNLRIVKILLVSPEFSDDFVYDCEMDTEMNLSLEGIGAVLQGEDDYTVIRSLVPGGPAAKSGENTREQSLGSRFFHFKKSV